MARWKKGQSGNPNGRPPGRLALEQLTNGIDPAELNIQETEVRERFRILNELYGWFEVVYSQVGFPDFILRDANGAAVRAEAETVSRNFLHHKHDAGKCDLIICWRHNWGDCPLPVLTLSVEWINYLQMRRVKPCIALTEQLDKQA